MISRPVEDLEERRAKYASLVERFGKGWEKLSATLMAEVFTEDATLVPDPWAAAVTGRAAIEQYWENIPYEQSEISFRFGEIYVAGPWFSTEFKCTFRRRRSGEKVDVRGGLFCETEGEAISEMRMYWDRRVGR
ncbi:MAG: nuclear transport factor 2 family protein [Gemmatimonadales bacterium]